LQKLVALEKRTDGKFLNAGVSYEETGSEISWVDSGAPLLLILGEVGIFHPS
jgi:hypothetical protein